MSCLVAVHSEVTEDNLWAGRLVEFLPWREFLFMYFADLYPIRSITEVSLSVVNGFCGFPIWWERGMYYRQANYKWPCTLWCSHQKQYFTGFFLFVFSPHGSTMAFPPVVVALWIRKSNGHRYFLSSWAATASHWLKSWKCFDGAILSDLGPLSTALLILICAPQLWVKILFILLINKRFFDSAGDGCWLTSQTN